MRALLDLFAYDRSLVTDALAQPDHALSSLPHETLLTSSPSSRSGSVPKAPCFRLGERRALRVLAQVLDRSPVVVEQQRGRVP
jgi:hypothetical protein